MKLRPAVLLLLAAATLAGCVETPPPEPREEDRKLERAVQEPLDKARAVEQQMQEAKERQDEEMREQED